MAAGARAALHLCTATLRNGCERPCLGAVEHGNREGGWLAFAHRHRSPPPFGVQLQSRRRRAERPGYALGMKTAISIPDEMFAEAEERRRRLAGVLDRLNQHGRVAIVQHGHQLAKRREGS